MGIHVVTGRGHGDLNMTHDVDNQADIFVLGSATEINSSGNPITGTATVWVSNLWMEHSTSVPAGKQRIHFRVRADWTADIDWQATLVTFKVGGPLG